MTRNGITKNERLTYDETIRRLEESNRVLMEVFAAQKMYVWEYCFATDTYTFPDDYFKYLQLDKAGIRFSNFKEMMDFVHPDDRQFINEELFKEKLKNTKEGEEALIRYVGAHGETVYVLDKFFEIERDGDGNPVRLRSFGTNVTEQCVRDMKLKAQEELNSKIIEVMPEFVFIFDRNLFIRDVMISNRPFFHTREEMIGMDGKTFYSSEVAKLLKDTIAEVLADGQVRTIDYGVTSNGFPFYYQTRIAPYGEDRALALIRDTTREVERSRELIEARQHAEESDKAKSIFLANISHEIRTPLNAIVGFSEVLLNTDEKAEQEECVGIIKKNSAILLRLINDVLDLARLQSGKIQMSITKVDLNDMVREVAKMHSVKPNVNVRIVADVPSEHITVETDGNRVTQVLFNFLSNAFKNTERGTITVGMRHEDTAVRLYVKDSGRGIPEDKLKTIFDSFVKLDEFVQGTGLGLAICKDIAHKLGARLEVESVYGKGSTFSLLLPL